MDKPFYPHDCTNCVFLGGFTEDEGTDQAIPYDLYFCGKSVPTVIARYGEAGGDYKSGLQFGKQGTDPALTEAYNRAVAKNLL